MINQLLAKIICILVLFPMLTLSSFKQKSIPKSWIVTPNGETFKSENDIYKTQILTNKKQGNNNQSSLFYYKMLFSPPEGFMIVKNGTNSNMLHPETGDLIRRFPPNGVPIFEGGPFESNQKIENPEILLDQAMAAGYLDVNQITMKFSKCVHHQQYLNTLQFNIFSHKQIMSILKKNPGTKSILTILEAQTKNMEFRSDGQALAEQIAAFLLLDFGRSLYFGDMELTEEQNGLAKGFFQNALGKIQKIKFINPSASMGMTYDNVNKSTISLLHSLQEMNLIIQTIVDAIYNGHSHYRLEIPSSILQPNEERKRMSATYDRVFFSMMNGAYNKYAFDNKINDKMINMSKNQLEKILMELDEQLRSMKLMDEGAHKYKMEKMFYNMTRILTPSRLEFMFYLFLNKDQYDGYVMSYYQASLSGEMSGFSHHFVDLSSIKPNDRPFTLGQVIKAWKYYDCLLYTSPSPRDLSTSRMPSSA